jgi:hypothetical protein
MEAFVRDIRFGLLTAYGFANTPRIDEIGINAQVFGFTLLISVLMGLVYGLFPRCRLLTRT